MKTSLPANLGSQVQSNRRHRLSPCQSVQIIKNTPDNSEVEYYKSKKNWNERISILREREKESVQSRNKRSQIPIRVANRGTLANCMFLSILEWRRSASGPIDYSQIPACISIDCNIASEWRVNGKLIMPWSFICCRSAWFVFLP